MQEEWRLLLLSNAASHSHPPYCPLPGPKSTTVQLLPRSATTVTWQAAPYHIGKGQRSG